VFAVAALVLSSSGACSLLVSTSGLAGPPVATGTEGGSPVGGDAMSDAPASSTDGSVDAEASSDGPFGCPSGLQGPSMVAIDAYCIDSTEVTNAQYAKFVQSKNGDISGQPATCAWNTTYVPAASCSLATADDAPVTCVDWCDAYAYCAWAGKRLCGHIGGGPSTPATAALAESDQWYRACSHAGAQVFPYGDTYVASACNDKPRGVAAPVAVGTSPGCQGGYPGLFDMSGNVVEWSDACSDNAGPNDGCVLRSGAFDDDSASGFLECASKNTNARSSVDETKGFRCCT
jgi:formylglycine-generating enzyme required for sulfatase activity